MPVLALYKCVNYLISRISQRGKHCQELLLEKDLQNAPGWGGSHIRCARSILFAYPRYPWLASRKVLLYASTIILRANNFEKMTKSQSCTISVLSLISAQYTTSCIGLWYTSTRLYYLPHIHSIWKYFIFIDKLSISHTQRDIYQEIVRVQTPSCLSSVQEIQQIGKEIVFSNQAQSYSTTLPSSFAFIDKVLWYNMHA